MPADIPYKNEDLKNALSELEIIDKKLLEESLEQANNEKKALGEILLQKDMVSEENLGRIISDLLDTPYINLSQIHIEDRVLNIVPKLVAKEQKVIAFNLDNEGLHLAMTNPEEKLIKELLAKKTGQNIVPYFTNESEVMNALSLYTRDTQESFDELIEKGIRKAKGASEEDPPIIKIVDIIIEHAYQNKASDIHIEPEDENSLVRFRIDGILHDIVDIPKELHSQIVTRVKVMADLRTDEHQKAQDGKIVFKMEGEDLDLRVSIVPITEGEKTVMRLLSERSRHFSLHDLGFRNDDLEKVQEQRKKPYGMILATGPTGSGKTTTLYSILKLLNKRDVNIMTIEDPVEYDIEGVNQIQVNTKTDLTFAKGLRSIVRQDPDIILVGEIRDKETADIAINAAMTGHLVLSTLHTNDSATAIPRLIDLGIEPFLVASTVNVIIAQRLVRKIHEGCRVSKEISTKKLKKEMDAEIVKKYFKGKSKARIYEGKGCKIDHGTGYSGRVGIFETLVIDDDIKDKIVAKADTDEIRKVAIKNGMTTILEDGVEKMIEGATTLEEILRVTKE